MASEAFLTLQVLNVAADYELPTRHIHLTKNRSEVFVGRSSQTDDQNHPRMDNCMFDSQVVSRPHGVIYADLEAKTIWISDIGSRHGLAVNGALLRPNEPTQLRNNDQVMFGQSINRNNVMFRPCEVRISIVFIEHSQTPFTINVPDDSDDESIMEIVHAGQMNGLQPIDLTEQSFAVPSGFPVHKGQAAMDLGPSAYVGYAGAVQFEETDVFAAEDAVGTSDFQASGAEEINTASEPALESASEVSAGPVTECKSADAAPGNDCPSPDCPAERQRPVGPVEQQAGLLIAHDDSLPEPVEPAKPVEPVKSAEEQQAGMLPAQKGSLPLGDQDSKQLPSFVATASDLEIAVTVQTVQETTLTDGSGRRKRTAAEIDEQPLADERVTRQVCVCDAGRPRPMKKVRRVARRVGEAVGFAALGGAAFFCTLLATAPDI